MRKRFVYAETVCYEEPVGFAGELAGIAAKTPAIFEIEKRFAGKLAGIPAQIPASF